MVEWRLMTAEEVAANDADPRTIEYRTYQERAARNARPHCPTCGRFGRWHRSGDDGVVRCSSHGDEVV